jgi:chaperonin GroES
MEKPKRMPPLDVTLRKLYDYAQSTNIAADLDEKELEDISAQVLREYEMDKQSREEWEQCAQKALDLALQVKQPKNFPFENASNVSYPLVTVAALQFGARAYPAIVDSPNIVKGHPIGEDQGQPAIDPQTGQPVMDPQTGEIAWEVQPGGKREKADRIAQHMSYQLLYQMEEWEEDTDVLLHHLPIVGCAFRKVWRDGRLGRNRVQMRPALKVVVNNAVESLDEAQRISDEVSFYPQEIEERVRSGEWLELDLPPADQNDEDSPHDFIEQHRFLDLDGDGYREPDIVTLHVERRKIARIVANFNPDDIEHDGVKVIRIPKRQYFVKYPFLRDPKGGFYDIGFGQLLESLGATIDTTINQMIDAGTLQNAGGGFIGSGLRLKKDQIRLSPGKYTYVEAPGSVLKDAIYNFEHPGASPVLFSLLELLLSAAKDITGVKDILTGDAGEKVQTATTTLAMVEQGLKVFTSIYKRVWSAMRQEFKLLFDLNAEFMDEEEYFTILDHPQAVAKQDYDRSTVDVMPVADARMVTDMQRAARAQFLLETFPIVPNKEEAIRRIFTAMGMENVDALLEMPQQEQGPSPEEMAMQAEAMKAQAEAETKMAIEQMKAQSTAELQMQIEQMRSDVEMAKKERESDLKVQELELKRLEISLKEQIAAAEAELKRRELETNAQLRREEIQSREKSEANAASREESKPKKEDGGEKKEPVTVNLNISESSSKKVKVERGKDGKITGAKVD